MLKQGFNRLWSLHAGAARVVDYSKFWANFGL